METFLHQGSKWLVLRVSYYSNQKVLGSNPSRGTPELFPQITFSALAELYILTLSALA